MTPLVFTLLLTVTGSPVLAPPAAYGSLAYASVDPEGYPILVYSAERIAAVEKAISSAPHEFLHTIQITLDEAGGEDAIHLAVAAWSEQRAADEVFAYRYALEYDTEEDGDDGGGEGDDVGPGGCACSQGASSGLFGAALPWGVVMLAWWRRPRSPA